ncbi:MAG: HEPN domain-containing protein [Conexibacter sp.]
MSQRDGRDLARRLLRRADNDATLVRRVIDDADIADAIIGFHAQQAVEKSIKAVLASREIEYGRTHQLHFLIRLLEEHEIDAPASVLDAVELNPWAVEFRYEEDDEPPLDRRATLAVIEEIRRWAGEAVER